MSRPSPTLRRPNPFLDHCRELLAPLGPVRSRAMFGGHGLYVDDLFLALIAQDQLYLKVDAHNRQAFVDAGAEPFTYERARADGTAEQAQLGYYRPPEDAMDNPAAMLPWARRAMEAALRAANTKSRPKAKAAANTPAVKPSRARTAKRTG